MAQTEYQYGIDVDFPSQSVSLLKLGREIAESSIATLLDRLLKHEETDLCSVFFADALSAPEEATLDGIVAAHDGIEPIAVENYSVENAGQLDTTSTEYVPVSGAVLVPSFGSYVAHFSASVEINKNNAELFVAFSYNGEILAGSERSMRRGTSSARHFAGIHHSFDADVLGAELKVVWKVSNGAGSIMDRSLSLRKKV